jgi:hypothetical protein
MFFELFKYTLLQYDFLYFGLFLHKIYALGNMNPLISMNFNNQL